MHPRHAATALLFPAILLLASCAATTSPPPGTAGATAARVAALLPADVILLGEQHDVPAHQRMHREAIQALAARGALAGVALEMAEQGTSTQGLPRGADEAAVQAALGWNDKAWPWSLYGPAVMEAVRAGVPVAGANLPRAKMREAMEDMRLDMQLPGPALKAQQQAIRIGHCNMLPEAQITPMTRIQVARDMAMAQTLASIAVPGKTAVLLAGGGHVDRLLGVPQHLPREMTVKAIRMQAEGTPVNAREAVKFDATWTQGSALPDKDYCAGVKAGSMQPQPE